MKLYITLIVTAVGMAFITGYYALFLQGSYVATPSDVRLIQSLKSQFAATHTPKIKLNLNSLYGLSGQYELLDPAFGSEFTTKESLESMRNSPPDCAQNLFTRLSSFRNHKNWIWEEFKCKKVKFLPLRFFQRAPYMHSSGRSFAFMAFTSSFDQFHSREWVLSNLPYFHVSELPYLKDKVGPLEGYYDLIEQLGPDALGGILQGKGLVTAKQLLIVNMGARFLDATPVYHFYLKSDFERFIRKSPFFVSDYLTGKKCLYRDGDVCWGYNVGHLIKLANKSSLLFFLGSLLLISLVIWLLLAKIRHQKMEDERKRMALRILTHEVRTPVTSLLLHIENLFKKFDELDEETQGSVLSISNDIHRLQRLTEMSRNYLKVQEGKKLFDFNPVKIDSLNDFIAQNLEPYTDKIAVTYLKSDVSFTLDPYWFSICIKNLVENALAHGQSPVEVQVAIIKKKLSISVKDGGECKFDTLDEMTYAFLKGSSSGGIGLGLNIVKRIIEEMKGELLYNKEPTRFTLTLKEAT